MAHLPLGPAQFCQAFFISIAVAAIGASVIPTLRKFVSYGPRTVPISERAVPSTDVKDKDRTVLDKLGGLRVPHTWFTHFYMISVASSAFWAYQLAADGAIFRLIVSRHTLNRQGRGMTINQILFTWALMAFQGSRRLYESIKLLKPSTAQMPVTSYALGVGFYLAVGVSIWAEGMSAIYSHHSGENFELTMPSTKTFVAILLFFIASGLQHDSHVYLASLKKYTLPERHLFRRIICPHYTCECAIYLALAIIAAPQGQVLNKTVSTVLMFTVVNLAITANSTRAWYVQKFGEESIKRRSRMIPYIY